jgi:polyvinyl alcohol dehydrogenase (cytochrome)
LFAGTKGADILALDPDANGKVLFRVNPSGQPVGFTGRGRGGIVWGGATDQRQVYYGMGAAGLARSVPPTARRRGCSPLGRRRPRSGRPRCRADRDPRRRLPGSGDGRLFAVSSTDGKQLWEFNTAQDIATANKVPARGGAIATAGAVIVDGMVYIGSGYAISSGAQAGNVLLAFGVE